MEHIDQRFFVDRQEEPVKNYRDGGEKRSETHEQSSKHEAPKTGACELIRPSSETDVSSVVTAAQTVGAGPISLGERTLSRVGLVLYSEKALHQGIVSLADQAVASATTFGTGVIIARACTKEEFGIYMLGYSVILLMIDFQTSLISTPYTVYAPRLKGRAHALYTGSTLIHQLTFCLLATLVLMCGAFAFTIGIGPRGLGSALWALAAVFAMIMLREFARRVCFASLKLKSVFFFDVFIAVSQISGLLALASFGLLSASRAYWVIGSVCGVAAFGWLWADRGFYEPRMRESLSDFKKNWMLGKWVFASGLAWAVSLNLCPWLLAAFHGVASTGVWAACLGVVSMGNPLLLGIQNFIGPKIAHVYAEKGPKALHQLVLKITVVVAIPMWLLCVVMFIWGGRLLTFLYGRQYADNSLVVAILALNLLVMAPGFSLSRALFAIDRADIDFLVNFTALFITVTLGSWLIRAYGPLGAAFGLLGANVVTSVVRAGAFLKLLARISGELEAA